MMKNYQVNDEGYYGEYGGAYIPESLKPCVEELKSKYIEIEMNTIDNKIIIRDNLKRTTISEDTPVLGWNRLCVKQGE